MKSWASVLLQVERLHLSLGLPKWMSRPTGMPVALPEFPKGRRSALREVARRIPPGAPSGQHPPGARASRPHALPWVVAQFPCDAAPGHTASGNPMGPAEAEPWRRCRSIRVEEMGEAMPRFVRAGRPRSRGAFSPDAVIPTSQYCRSIRAPLVVEGLHPYSCLFVFIRGSSSFPKRKRLAVSPLTCRQDGDAVNRFFLFQ